MSEHTPGPWVGFSDQGKVVAIMPAGRDGDICTFNQSPSDADARLMTLAPALLKTLQAAQVIIGYAAEGKSVQIAAGVFSREIDGILNAVGGPKQP